MTHRSIRITTQTSKQLHQVLARAYKAGDLPLVKNVSALLAIGRDEDVAVMAASLGVSASRVYAWRQTFLVAGVDGLRVQWRGGRPPKRTPTQKQRLAEWVEAGPEAAGSATGCW
jgi:hypothetical protein